MSAHTPGRLVVVERYDGAKASTDKEDGAALVVDGAMGNAVVWAGNGETYYPTSGYMDLPDARRLAACWNACEGLPTEQVEELADAGGAAGSLLCIDELRANYQKKINEVFGISSELVAARARPVIPDGWAMSSADFSIIANGGVRPGNVTLVRTGVDRANWHAHADADLIPLHAVGRGPDFLAALSDAIKQAAAAPPVPTSKDAP